MTWIESVSPDRASGRLRSLYDRIAGPNGQVDNILRVHGLRPHTLEGHMTLYKAVLHHAANRLEKTLLEAIGVYVSLLNGCDYCVEHHAAGLRRLVNDDLRADALQNALANRSPADAFSERECAALRYASRLTLEPASIQRADVDTLREAGFDDGDILEINQVTAYFAYANRTVLGLGVDAGGEVLGLSPGNAENAADWVHG